MRAEMRVLDASGRLLQKYQLENTETTEISNSTLEPGIYYLHLWSKGNTYSKEFIIQ